MQGNPPGVRGDRQSPDHDVDSRAHLGQQIKACGLKATPNPITSRRDSHGLANDEAKANAGCIRILANVRHSVRRGEANAPTNN